MATAVIIHCGSHSSVMIHCGSHSSVMIYRGSHGSAMIHCTSLTRKVAQSSVIVTCGPLSYIYLYYTIKIETLKLLAGRSLSQLMGIFN